MGGQPKESATQKQLEAQELQDLQEEQARQKEQDELVEKQKLAAIKGFSQGGTGGLFTGSGLRPSVGGTIGSQKLGQ